MDGMIHSGSIKRKRKFVLPSPSVSGSPNITRHFHFDSSRLKEQERRGLAKSAAEKRIQNCWNLATSVKKVNGMESIISKCEVVRWKSWNFLPTWNKRRGWKEWREKVGYFWEFELSAVWSVGSTLRQEVWQRRRNFKQSLLLILQKTFIHDKYI